MTTIILHIDDGEESVAEYRLPGSALLVRASQELDALMKSAGSDVGLLRAALREQDDR